MPAKKTISRKAPSRKKTAGKKRKVAKKKTAAKKPSTKKKTVARKKPVSKKKASKKKASKKKVSKKKVSTKKASKKKLSKKKSVSRKKPASKKKKVSKTKAVTRKVSKKKVSKKKAVAKKSPTKKKAVAKKAPSKKTVSRKKTPVKAAAPKMAPPKKKPLIVKSRAKRADVLSGPIHGIEPYDVKRGEEYMSQGQLAHFQNILSSWKSELMNEVDRTVHHMQDEAANFPDPNDRATQESEFGLELRTRDRERKLLRKITQAISRIEDGSYGYCDETGEEIGLKRLEARPVATMCVEAQERREMAERQFRDRDDRYR